MNETTKLQKGKNVHWKAVDGEAVLMRLDSGDYYALDPVGTFLWTKLSKSSMRYEELLNCIMLEYNCSKEIADQDLKDFCSSLVAEKLLELKASEPALS